MLAEKGSWSLLGVRLTFQTTCVAASVTGIIPNSRGTIPGLIGLIPGLRGPFPVLRPERTLPRSERVHPSPENALLRHERVHHRPGRAHPRPDRAHSGINPSQEGPSSFITQGTPLNLASFVNENQNRPEIFCYRSNFVTSGPIKVAMFENSH